MGERMTAMWTGACIALLSLGVSATLTEEAAAGNAAVSGFSVIDRVPGPDGGWDYSMVDAGAHRLYIGRDNGVAALDLVTRKWTPEFVSGQEVHGITAIGNTGVLMSTNGRGKSVTFFDGATGKTRPYGRQAVHGQGRSTRAAARCICRPQSSGRPFHRIPGPR
jgi:hypothetical protein